MSQAVSRAGDDAPIQVIFYGFSKNAVSPVQILKFCDEAPRAGTNGVNRLMSYIIEAAHVRRSRLSRCKKT